MKHIYKHSLETSFFKLITSDNEVAKETIEGNPSITWRENETAVYSWSYVGDKGEQQRDNDFEIILSYRGRIIG